jgi:hypothetical protein
MRGAGSEYSEAKPARRSGRISRWPQCRHLIRRNVVGVGPTLRYLWREPFLRANDLGDLGLGEGFFQPSNCLLIAEPIFEHVADGLFGICRGVKRVHVDVPEKRT